MHKFYLAFGLTCLMSMFVANTIQASFTQVDGYSVVFDDRNDLYWLQTAPIVGGDFQNSLAALDALNAVDDMQRLFGEQVLWGTWRIAKRDDMTKLWSYEAEELADTFIGNASSPYYIFGRYDEVPSQGQHYAAGIFLADSGGLELSALPEISVNDNEDLQWLGSWIAADAAAAVPLPASAILLSSGIAGLFGFRLTKRKKN